MPTRVDLKFYFTGTKSIHYSSETDLKQQQDQLFSTLKDAAENDGANLSFYNSAVSQEAADSITSEQTRHNDIQVLRNQGKIVKEVNLLEKKR